MSEQPSRHVIHPESGGLLDMAKWVWDMTSGRTLTEMVEAARDGDRDAWNRLVERYMPVGLSVARRYQVSADDAADVSQALWLRLVEHLDKIRDPRALPGWIVTTTTNEALRFLKIRRRS